MVTKNAVVRLNPVFLLGILLILLFLLSGCFRSQSRATDAIEAVPVPENQGVNDFQERKTVLKADELRNRRDVIFFSYYLAADGQLITQWTCVGSPTSSTESVEPNTAYTTSSLSYGWNVPLEGGQNGYTNEMMGIDGTYGDPVPFLFCITPTGQYYQWSTHANVLVSTIPLSFPERLVQVDEGQWMRIKAAEEVLRQGGCLDEALNEIACPEEAPTEQPAPIDPNSSLDSDVGDPAAEQGEE